MAREPGSRKHYPTISRAHITGTVAELKFQLWALAENWLVRDRRPDVFIDFMVEITEDYEPTARHFWVQVKGRTAKLGDGQLREKFETKHLRYYQKCREPVFLFRIDPESGSGHWLFAQHHLKQKSVAEKLSKQGSMKLVFDPEHILENRELFKRTLKEAQQFMASEFPGSPVAALAKRKAFLESLDPNVVIEISATDKGVSAVMNPKPGVPIAGPNIAGHFTKEQWEALNSGQPVTIQASKLKADSPVAQHIFSEAGDDEIVIKRDLNFPKITGSAQLKLDGVSDFLLQVNGDWTLTPTRLTFEGTIPETPFSVKSVWIGAAPDKFGNPDVTFGFKVSNWEGQPLSHLGYFDDFKQLFRGHPLRLRFLMRGQQLYAGSIQSPDLSPGEWLAESVEWIGKLKQGAEYFRVNPPFPGKARLSSLTSEDVRIAVALATTGTCVRSFAESSFTATGVFPQAIEPHPTELGRMKFFDQYEELDFLGTKVKVGPLSLAWEDVRLVAVRKHENGQKSLRWKGSPTGRMVLKLNDPLPPDFPS